MTSIERCSFLLLLLTMMGVLCNANHQQTLLTPDGNKICSYTKTHSNQYCDSHKPAPWAQKWFYTKLLSDHYTSLASCMSKARSDSDCSSTIISGYGCKCLRNGKSCKRKDSTYGNSIYTFSCQATCQGKCSGRWTAKADPQPGKCQGGICKKNDYKCCELKKCTGCNGGFYALSEQTPQSCNGHCPKNDAHCCAHKECGECTWSGWTKRYYAISNPTPENCNGNCQTNAPQCCALKTCGECYGEYTARGSWAQEPEHCSGNGNCYNNDPACCRLKECAPCTGEYLELSHQNPAGCDGQCQYNDLSCCRHAPKSLIHRNTHTDDFEITELYELTFSVTVFSTRSSTSNVLHLTTTSNGNGVGGRVPAVFLQYATTKLQACAECDGNTNTCVTSNDLTVDVDYEVMVKMDEETFSIHIDGQQHASVDCVSKYQPAPETVATVWTSNPWNHPAFAHVERVEYKQIVPFVPTVTGWQNVQYGMSCTSHRLLAGTGKSEEQCKALCEANAMCHSIFWSEEGLRTCTLCSSYSPGPAIKLDNTIYVDPLNKYRMAQYKRPHIMDVQWYHYPMYTCEDEYIFPGLKILTYDECLALAAVNGQTTLSASPYLKSGCAMDTSGEYYWTPEDIDFWPTNQTWDELLICKFEPETDGLEAFSTSPSSAFPQATDGSIQTCSSSEVSGGKNYVEIDIDGELSLMKLWIATGTDNHVQHGHTADHSGTQVTVLAYNGAKWVPCASTKLKSRKQWTQVVCESALYTEKIRIESTEHAFTIADTRVFGITPTSGTYLAAYPWTSAIADTPGYDWHLMEDHRGCFNASAGETTSAGTYKTTECRGNANTCEAQAKNECDSEWKLCWGIGLRYVHGRMTIEFYNAQAVNPMKCAGVLGLKEDDSWRVQRRRSLQLYDVMVNSGPCWSYNWFTGQDKIEWWCLPREEEFANLTVSVLRSVRDCTVKATLEDTVACYREMAAREIIGHDMYDVLAARKDETLQCIDSDRRRVPDWAPESEETDEASVMRRRLQPAIDVAKYGGSKQRAFIAAVMPKSHTDSNATRRAELESQQVDEMSFYGAPWDNRRRSSSHECWAQATMLNTLACENLKGAAEVTLEVMKTRRGIALDEINLMNRQAGSSFIGGVGGFIAGLAGGASTHAAGGPAGVALGVASSLASGMTDLFCGFSDFASDLSQAALAKRETQVMLREIGAQEMQALSDRVQVCDMPSTSDIKCMLGDMEEGIKSEMRAGFDSLGHQVQNVLRTLDDNHNEIMREFLKVEAILAGNTIALQNLKDMISTVLHELSINTSLWPHAMKLGAIEEAQQWFAKWSEEDPETRLNHFQDPQGVFWCDELVKKLGSVYLPTYIKDWVASTAFRLLAKPSPCTPESYAAEYTLHHKSFESLFEFVAMMKLYIYGYSTSSVEAITAVRLDMAQNFRDTLNDINAMASC